MVTFEGGAPSAESSKNSCTITTTTTESSTDRRIYPITKPTNPPKEQSTTAEVEKSERSSSPAFDSDDESTTTTAIQQQSSLKKRSSVVGTMMAQAFVKKSILTNTALSPTSPVSNAQTLSKILENRHDTDNNNLAPKVSNPPPLSPIRSDYSSSALDEPTPIPTASRNSSIPTTTHSSPTATHHSFTENTMSSERPRSLLVTSFDGNVKGTYDVLIGLDGADLRYMDESSVIVPSPNCESPPSSISTFPNTSTYISGPSSPMHHSHNISSKFIRTLKHTAHVNGTWMFLYPKHVMVDTWFEHVG